MEDAAPFERQRARRGLMLCAASTARFVKGFGPERPSIIDVGLFLRAGEALPAGFRDAFVAGYRDAGGELPSEWLRLSRLIDLVSQVTFLNDPLDRPRVFAETADVVEETVRMLT